MSTVQQLALDLGDGGPAHVDIDTKTGRKLGPNAPPHPKAKAVATQVMESFAKRVKVARKLGEEGAQAAAGKAEDVCPGFSTRVQAFIERYARRMAADETVRGEDLVTYMKAMGIVPHDDRAFGSMFAKAIRDGFIRPVGSVARTKGHGAPGGQVYVRGPQV